MSELCKSWTPLGELDRSAVVENLQLVLARIEEAWGSTRQTAFWRNRKPSLVAVSKTKPAAVVECCYGAGQLRFGENYIQELADKADALKLRCPDIQWHFIGTIAKLAEIENLSCVETVCSMKHCTILEREMARRNRKLNVLVQVNTSREEQKGGTTPQMATELAQFIRVNCPSLKFTGFMTIGSFERSTTDTFNEDFEELFKVRKRFCEVVKENEDDFELSMGMSHDFETAIAQGSTSVRVGSAIFGPRLKKVS